MWFLKKSLLGLALVVGAVCPSFAATVAPLYFQSLGTSSDVNPEQQQVYWERLMKYKLWGTHSLNFTNQKVSIGDNIGYNGTADGNVVFNYPHHHIGGPTLVGGNLSFNAGSPDSITTGPVRILGNLTVSLQNSNVMEGDWCVQGTITGQYDGNLVAWNNLLDGAVYNDTYTLNKKAGTYAQCPSTVPPVNTELEVPIWPAPAKMDTSINMTSCYGGEKFFIHVPPDTVQTNEYGTYDLYIDQMNVSCTNNKTLYIVMPPKGKLTRIYSKNGYVFSNAANDLRIQVLTVQNGVEYNRTTKQWQLGQTYDASKGFWTGEDNSKFNYVDNKTYGGNVLFYTPKDIKWDYWVDANFQGSWISTGKITIGGHFKLAGQVIANNLDFQADVSGDFRYVPFDPPQIGLNLASNQKISENDSLEAVASAGSYTGTSLNIELDKAPETNVEFDYCFLISNSAANAGTNNANFKDIDTAATHIPICGRDTVYAARIYKGETQLRPADEIKVWIHDDKDEENREFFNLRIFNMVGGVFPDGSRDRTVPFQILDNDGSASPCNVDSKSSEFTIPEDASIILSGAAFPAVCSDATVLPVYNVHIKTLPLKGKLYLGSNEVHANDVIASANLQQLKYVPARDSNGTPMDSIKFQVEDVYEHVTTSTYTVTLNVLAANDAPYAQGFTVSVRENAPVDSVIATVVGTDADAATKKSGEYYTLTYTIIEGNANDLNGNPSFAINESTGKISIKGKLDFEHIDRFPLKVRVSDDGGLYKDIIVVVNITDENEPPVANGCVATIAENSAINLPTGCWIEANDPETGHTSLKYSITAGNTGNVFKVDNDGNILVNGLIDYESLPAGAKYYTLTVTVKDNNGASGAKSTTATAKINITNENEKPTVKGDTCWIVEGTTTPFLDKATNGNSKTCKVTATDPEGKSLSYSFASGNTDNTFKINSSTGVVTVNTAPDYEDIQDFYLFVDVNDDANTNTVTTLVLVHVINVNEAPTVTPYDCSIPENSAINLVTGCYVKAQDQDGDQLSFTIKSATQNGKNFFRVDANGNIVVTRDDIDYDTMSPKYFDITVTVSDNHGGTTDATVRVTITNEDENPVVRGDTCWIAENTTKLLDRNGNEKTCKVTATDPEKLALTYSIVDATNPNAAFAISTSGVVTANTAPDYEITHDFHLFVDVTDKGGNTVRTLVLVNVINVNERPTATVTDANVDENSRPNTYVTWVDASDIEDGYNLTYQIVGGDPDGAFTIVSSGQGNDNDGEIRVAKDIIDFETKDSYTLTVLICDKGTPGTAADTLCIDKTVTITVKDGNEKPSITGFPDKVIDEHTPVGTVVGTVSGDDPEDGTITYSFAGGNNGQAFSIDPSTGEITVARDIDFEALTDTVFKIKVRVTDNGGLMDETFINIAIRDINDSPEIDDATMTVAENQPKGTTVGTLEHYDPDTKNENKQNTYQVIGGDKDLFTIDATTGVIKTNAVFDYEAKTSYSVVVRIYDQDGNADTATVKINIADVKESSNIEITYAETESGAQDWDHPTGTIYTNENAVLLQWKADNKPMPDTLLENLHEGLNVITLTYTDPTKNKGVTETIGIYVSTRTPEVTVTTSAGKQQGANIYTLVETVDESDTSVYVNKKNNDIVITVKEPVLDASYTDSTCNYESRTFTINTELEPVNVSTSTYDVVNKVVKSAPVLNENPKSEVTYSQYNNDLVKVSYTEKVAGVDVEISYLKDKDGNVQKVAVVNANGKVDSIEVMTVSYQVKVGGKNVTVSYAADAATGQALKTTTVSGSSGNGSNSASNNGSSSASNNGSGTAANSGSNGGNSGSNNGSGTGNSAPVYAYSLTEGEVLFTVTYDFTTKVGGRETTVQVGYTVDQKGNITKDKDGNVGYEVSYTYVNEMGNSSTQSVFIVVDLVPPEVKILSPESDAVLYSNMANVEWCVDLHDGRGCVKQDSLNVEGLQPGEVNEIVRFYRDKAGNEASAVVYVMAKNTKDVDISVEKPVTVITKELVEQYYAAREPEKGQTFSISIYNPQVDKEVETMIGGSFKNKQVHNDSVYPGLPGHLGPTLGIDVKVPMVNTVDGLATLDDLVGSDGMILLDAVDAVGSRKMTVDDYVQQYCSADFQDEMGSDISKANIYDTKMKAKIWIYTSLGQFVDYFSFTQDLNDPSYASDAGVLSMYFEMKPDKNGDVRTKDGKLYATGAYVYKTEISMTSKLRCDLPPFDDATNVNKIGTKKKVKEDLLKSFGYKRPKMK